MTFFVRKKMKQCIQNINLGKILNESVIKLETIFKLLLNSLKMFTVSYEIIFLCILCTI